MKSYIKTTIHMLTICCLSITMLTGQCLTDNTFQGTTDNVWGTASNWSSGCVSGGGTITGVINIAADCVVGSGIIVITPLVPTRGL